MPENTRVKSNRDLGIKRLKERYPDKEFADDESIFGQINEDYDVYDKQLGEYKEREKSISDLFASDPRSASFLTDWRKGEDPLIGFIRRFGDDFKSALEDPEKAETLALANKEYADRIAKEKEYEEQYQKNLSETLDTIEQVKESEGRSDDDIDRAMAFLLSIIRDGIMGKFSSESIRMAFKALDYDADIAAAGYEGEVKGRNTNIQERLRKSRTNDGTADLAGKNGSAGTRRAPTSIFTIAEGAK